MVEYMEFLRATKAQTSGNLGETELATPVGRSTNEIIAIHLFEIMHVTTVWAASKYFQAALSRKSVGSGTTVPNIDSSDVITSIDWKSAAGALAQAVDHKHQEKFYPPVLIANNKLYVDVKTDLGNEVTPMRIGYTIRRVTRAELLEALVD